MLTGMCSLVYLVMFVLTGMCSLVYLVVFVLTDMCLLVYLVMFMLTGMCSHVDRYVFAGVPVCVRSGEGGQLGGQPGLADRLTGQRSVQLPLRTT